MKKRIFVIFVGRPQDSDWKMVTDDATTLMQEVEKLGHESGAFDDKHLHHRRGEFVALPVGVSYGGGATVCLFLSESLLMNAHLLAFRNQAILFIQSPGSS